MWLMVIGILFLIFRFYTAEIRMVKLLGFRRRFISRTICYAFAFAAIFEFQNLTLNSLMFMATVPYTIIFLLTDVPFIYRFKHIMAKMKIENKSDRAWFLIERMTLHLPEIIVGYWMFSNVHAFFNMSEGYWPFIFCLLICVTPYFALDRRWKERAHNNTGYMIIFLYGMSWLTILIVFSIWVR